MEANLWLHERFFDHRIKPRTVESNADALRGYANWLEETNTKWWDFPIRMADRCLIKYRGSLVLDRDSKKLASSTVTQRMRTIIRFYDWLKNSKLISTSVPMWKEGNLGIQLDSAEGFSRTINVRTTDLSIPNRIRTGIQLEDGLVPISGIDKATLLSFVREECSEELFLMLTLGFYTGMRIGTISDLKIDTLLNAAPDIVGADLYWLAVGPAADPPVATKYDVSGRISIAKAILDELIRYASSPRRLKREVTASPEFKDNVFLTKYGNPYVRRGSNKSGAINVEMNSMRKRLRQSGHKEFDRFHFHQSRCTFATQLARIAKHSSEILNAVSLIKEVLLQKDEKTAWAYIRFVEKNEIEISAGNAFSAEFMGLLTPTPQPKNHRG